MHAFKALQRILPSRLRESARDLAEVALRRRPAQGINRVPQSVWDDEYARGRWEYLDNIEEMARYAVIAGYCRHHGNVSSVLDLGCGAGLLRRWLRPLEPIFYVGVDLSNVAIEAARNEWTDESSKFVAMDVETFVPDRKFDVIVLNEVLYYFDDPDLVLTRFAAFLEENGKLVISVWNSPDCRRAWGRSRGSVHMLDEVQIRHQSGVSWDIRLCRPRTPARPERPL